MTSKTPLNSPLPINLDNLRDITGGDQEMEDMLLSMFITDSEEILNSLENESKDGESVIWSEQAHALKGAAENLGATRLAELSLDAQLMRVATADKRKQLLGAIREEFELVVNYIQSL